MLLPLWETIQWFLTKLDILLLFNPVNVFFVVVVVVLYLTTQKRSEQFNPHKTCTQMFILALFIVVSI